MRQFENRPPTPIKQAKSFTPLFLSQDNQQDSRASYLGVLLFAQLSTSLGDGVLSTLALPVQPWRTRARVLICPERGFDLAALAAGMFSGWPTSFAQIWKDQAYRFCYLR